jgi:ribosome-associated protein
MPRRPPPADIAQDDTALAPSKSRLKRESHELQRLGEALAQLPDDRLATLALPGALHDALLEYRRTRSHEGRRRQLQYVGRLMRAVDPARLRDAVAASRLGGARDTLRLHEAERWRDALLGGGDDALTRWLHDHPAADAQRLRSLVRAGRREGARPAETRNPRPYRELYQFLRHTLDAEDHE